MRTRHEDGYRHDRISAGNPQKCQIGFIWMLAVFLVGFIVIANLQQHANDTGALNGTAGLQWNNFMGYIWVAISLLALTPLIMVIMVFAGLFGALGGGTS